MSNFFASSQFGGNHFASYHFAKVGAPVPVVASTGGGNWNVGTGGWGALPGVTYQERDAAKTFSRELARALITRPLSIPNPKAAEILRKKLFDARQQMGRLRERVRRLRAADKKSKAEIAAKKAELTLLRDDIDRLTKEVRRLSQQTRETAVKARKRTRRAIPLSGLSEAPVATTSAFDRALPWMVGALTAWLATTAMKRSISKTLKNVGYAASGVMLLVALIRYLSEK